MKPHPGGRIVPHVAEHHRLDVDAVPRSSGIPLGLPVVFRPVVVPGPEHGVARHLELDLRVLREILPGALLHQRLELPAEVHQVARAEVDVVGAPRSCFFSSRICSKWLLGDSEDDDREHREEAAVAIVREAGVAGLPPQALRRSCRSVPG